MPKIADFVKLKSGYANFIELKSAFEAAQKEGLSIYAMRSALCGMLVAIEG
jgi:hypothetical protein